MHEWKGIETSEGYIPASKTGNLDRHALGAA